MVGVDMPSAAPNVNALRTIAAVEPMMMSIHIHCIS